MTAYERKLAEFGAVVLEILEADVEWNTDTTDLIAARAFESGLARPNSKTGLFQRVPASQLSTLQPSTPK